MNLTPPLPRETETNLSSRSKRRWGRRVAIGLGVAAVACGIAVSPLTQTSEQRLFSRALDQVASIGAASSSTRTLSTRIEFVRAKGLPKAFADLHAEVALAMPDRLWVSTMLDGQPIQAARVGQRIWSWQPTKSFGIVAEAGVPRFSTAPESSKDTTELGPLQLPIDWKVRSALPRLLSLESEPEEIVDGQRCRVVKGGFHGWAVERMKLPRGLLTLWLREGDDLPVRIAYREGEKTDVVLAFRQLALDAPMPAARWEIPAKPGGKVERVALSHMLQFMESLPRIARTKLPSLGPARGEKKLLASHGGGRLEDHDGTRVLFLRGTPEQMGEQHGKLLESEVHDLVNRILYGVGVGSSFAKGRWFFGEIEEAQRRIDPFVDPRYLREMDALASAAGLEKEEVRLANFFPELFHCSGFALMGEATTGGRIFHGRVLDYMKGLGLEKNAVVIVYQPEKGHSWVNVSYAGFIGTVTAMNDQQISIGEMGGKGEGNWDGKPMAQLLREVMEKASTLDEAIEILRRGPRTCEYFYVIADGKSRDAVGIAATPDTFEVIRRGESHPRLQKPVKDTVLLSSGGRYEELARRAELGFGTFDADSARALMTRPVCMNSNIHSVLFAPDTLDFWVANADDRDVASHTRYTKYNLAALLGGVKEAVGD